MMDIYTEHHPHHEIGPVEHLKYVGAQYYTTLLSRLTSHIKNEDVHVSNEDRYKWDNKADKTALRELEMKVAELTPSSSDKEDIDLSTYATHAWVDENYAKKGQYPTYEELSSRYALKTDIPSVADFATRTYVDNAIAGINPGSDIDPSKYATQSQVLQLAQKDELLDSKINDLQDQVNSIDEYVLPTASNNVKGGIKTGYKPSGDFNYPIKMDGEYAYVTVPFSTTGGGDIIVTSLYGIEIVSNTLKLQNNILTGSVVWKISEASGSSYSYIMPGAENVSTYSQILPNNLRLSFTSNIQDGTYVGYALNVQIDVADYVAITVEKNGSVVARQVIPILNPGSNGEDGTTTVEYQSLEYPVIRLAGEYNFSTQYNDGTYNENGVYYIDVISCEGALYKAINPGGNRGGLTQRPYPERDQGWDEYWEPFSIYGQAAFDTLLANSAYITTLASKQIVVVDNQGVPVAGLLSNDATITTTGGTYTRNGVRIFAGETNGDITTAPFRVYDDGSVAIDKGSFTATYGSAMASLLIWNSRGVTKPQLLLTDGYSQRSELTDTGLSIENQGDLTTILASGIDTTGYVTAKDGSFSNSLDVNGTVNIIGNLLLNGNPINNSVYTDDTQNRPEIGYYLYSDWTFGEDPTAKNWIGRCIATPETSLDGNYVWACDCGDGIMWSNLYDDSVLANKTTVGDAILDLNGKENTKELLNSQHISLVAPISDREYTAANAAKAAFNDCGYLPSAGELNAYAETIRRIFGNNYGYWSSTEASSQTAWALGVTGVTFYEINKGEQSAHVLAFCKTRSYPTPQDLWVDITTAQSFYTFQIKDGLLQGIFHRETADNLAKVGDRILQLNIDNGDSAAYYKTASGPGIEW